MVDYETRYPIRQLLPAIAAALRGAGQVVPAGLAWRTKQIQRQDWPTTMEQDAQIKRGYTPAQTLRLLAALSLLDAGLGPTQAVAAASDNENSILGIMAGASAEQKPDAQRLVALVRPRALDGPGIDGDEQGGLVVEPITVAEVYDRLLSAGAGPAWLVVDLAAQCRGLLALLASDTATRTPFAAVLQRGVRETLAGRGHVPVGHPRGDRYRTRGGGTRGRDKPPLPVRKRHSPRPGQ